VNDSALIVAQASALFDGECDPIANAANLSALIFGGLPDLNWAGFYFVRDDELVLGPFQGKTACVRIPRGRGVCGTAWEKRATLVVPDVHAFPGHIACDSASNSEVVVPLVLGDDVLGVLDVDSPVLDRFGPDDVRMLETLASLYVAASGGIPELRRRA
jgi:L-methionine (R)-S-oxide reductase